MAPRSKGPSTMRFDVQQYLHDMKQELQQGQAALSDKMDEGFLAMAAQAKTHEKEDREMFQAQDKRITDVEGVTRNLKWGIRAVIGTGLAVVGDALVTLVHRK